MANLLKLKGGRDARYTLDALGRSLAIIEFTPSGEILFANDNFLQAVGYTLDEVRGHHHRMFVDPEDAQSADYQQFWHDLANGTFKSTEFRRIHKSGTEIWIQASYNPVFDSRGKVTKVIKIASDVTEQTNRRIRAESKIGAMERSQGVIEFDLDGNIVDVNDNFLAVVRYSRDEVVGRHHRMFADRAYASSREYSAFWRDLREGKRKTGEFHRLANGGHSIWIQASYNPIMDQNGKVCGVVKFASDITKLTRERDESARQAEAVKESFMQIVTEIQNAHQQTETIATSADETTKTVQAVADSTHEFSTSIGEISKNMTQSTTAVEEVVGEVGLADGATQALVSSAEAMNNINSMIDDIAGQINLLALNATIESARAGEAGKGFAVVASEVKNLASQVGRATSQISDEISGIQSISSDVVKHLEQIRNAVGLVDQSVSGVASAVEEQSAMTNEIAQNTRSASEGVEQTCSGIEMVATAMESANNHANQGLNIINSAERKTG